LCAYPWPGNVRELRNTIERAVVLAEGPRLEMQHVAAVTEGGGTALDFDLMPSSTASSRPPISGAGGLRDEVKALERERIERALEANGGNQRRTADALGISRGALLRRLDLLGIRGVKR
jgi:two-component system response regulator AtoC